MSFVELQVEVRALLLHLYQLVTCSEAQCGKLSKMVKKTSSTRNWMLLKCLFEPLLKDYISQSRLQSQEREASKRLWIGEDSATFAAHNRRLQHTLPAAEETEPWREAHDKHSTNTEIWWKCPTRCRHSWSRSWTCAHARAAVAKPRIGSEGLQSRLA